MTNSKTTKRALLSSVVALFICFTMLLGTTFAWFTDSATSGRNIIQSGNLDVVLEYTTDLEEEWAPVTEESKLFNDEALYEPGYTEVVFLRVSNAGSLALKYNLNVNIYSETSSTNVYEETFYLKDYLEIGYCVQDEADNLMSEMFDTRENALSNVTTKKLSEDTGIICADTPVIPGTDTAQVVAIVLTMPTTVGNEANHMTGVDAPTIDLGVTLLATQYTYESDSFDDQYDANADYNNPEDQGYEVVYIYNLEDFAAFGTAVNNNDTYYGVNVANNSNVWVEVMADIDMTNAPAIQATEFAIGDGSNLMFSGVFDGNNHTISNYHIDAAWTYNVSLFRTVGAGFTMRDIVFDNCSASKTNNRGTGLIVGTYGSNGAITFDNVDVKNSTVAGATQVGAYVYKMTEGAIYFIDCDAENVTLTATNDDAVVGMFLGDGYSHHDYEESGVWVDNCTMTGCKAIVNNVEQTTIAEYNYTK